MTNQILKHGYWGEGITAELDNGRLTLTSKIKGAGIEQTASNSRMEGVSELRIVGTIKYISADVFSEIQSLRLVIIDSEDFDYIGYKAFENCKYLERVILNGCQWLREIGADSFWGCRSLKYVNIPKGVKHILGGAFSYCENLESIEFPEGLETINTKAFIGCSSLTKLNIPKTVRRLGEEAFHKCSNILEVKMPRYSEIEIGDRSLPVNAKRKFHELNRPHKVLWFSRHQMTEDQFNSLRARLGEFELTQVDKSIESTREIRDEIESSDVLAVVAPPELLSEFFDYCNEDNGKVLIFAESERVLVKSEDGSESKVIFSFKRWVKIQKFEYETCTFCN